MRAPVNQPCAVCRWVLSTARARAGDVIICNRCACASVVSSSGYLFDETAEDVARRHALPALIAVQVEVMFAAELQLRALFAGAEVQFVMADPQCPGCTSSDRWRRFVMPDRLGRPVPCAHVWHAVEAS